MENMERKNLEITDDQLEQATGGTTNGNGHEVLFPSVPLLQKDDVSVEPIPDAPSSLPGDTDCTALQQEDNNMKNTILNELDDDALDNVSAGIEVGNEELLTINVWNDAMLLHPDPSEEDVVGIMSGSGCGI